MSEQTKEAVPYHGEGSRLEQTLNVGAGLFIPIMTQPFESIASLIFLFIGTPLLLIPFIATLRWRPIDREDSWNRIVAKRLRDTSLVYLVVMLGLPAFLGWILGSQVNQLVYSSVIFTFGLLAIYFHILYRKMVTLQNVPLSRDQKKWEGQIFRYAGPIAIVALFVALFLQIV